MFLEIDIKIRCGEYRNRRRCSRGGEVFERAWTNGTARMEISQAEITTTCFRLENANCFSPTGITHCSRFIWKYREIRKRFLQCDGKLVSSDYTVKFGLIRVDPFRIEIAANFSMNSLNFSNPHNLQFIPPLFSNRKEKNLSCPLLLFTLINLIHSLSNDLTCSIS